MDIFYIPATKALKLFREKKLSPVELIQSIIKRAEEINQKTNAFNFTFFEKAIDDAKKSEKKFIKNDSNILPLEGIPLAIKDEEDIKDQPNTNGSLVLKDHIADSTIVDVERLSRNNNF